MPNSLNSYMQRKELKSRLFQPAFAFSLHASRALSVAGPAAWNSLPDYMYLRYTTSSLDSFRRGLKVFLS